MHHDVADIELCAHDLREQRVQPLTHLDGCGVDLRLRLSILEAQRDARRGRVVEAFAERDVLEADGETDAALEALATRDVPGAAGVVERVAAGDRLGLGSGMALHASISSRTGAAPCTT